MGGLESFLGLEALSFRGFGPYMFGGFEALRAWNYPWPPCSRFSPLPSTTSPPSPRQFLPLPLKKPTSKTHSKFVWLLEHILEQSWVDFEVENGAMLAPKWGSKWMLTYRGRFSQNYTKHEKSTIFGSGWVQVGTKITPKTNPKTMSLIKCVLTSIFINFWSIWRSSWSQKPTKMVPKSIPKSIPRGLWMTQTCPDYHLYHTTKPQLSHS